jgi:nucleotide-binding universal stress UspA family protein
MSGDRIVVGVDGSASSRAALRWAVRQARITGGSVDAVIAWELPRTPQNYGWAQVVHGHPAQVLLDAADGADLLVVGHRGHDSFAGALLGSVGQDCVHHARGPVLIVR